MEPNYKEIGKRIKKYREERELSQAKLAEKIEVSVPYMSDIETGKTKFSLPVLVNLVNALEVRPEELLTEKVCAEGELCALILREIDQQLTDCTEMQMQLLAEAFRNEKKLLVAYEEKMKRLKLTGEEE